MFPTTCLPADPGDLRVCPNGTRDGQGKYWERTIQKRCPELERDNKPPREVSMGQLLVSYSHTESGHQEGSPTRRRRVALFAGEVEKDSKRAHGY